MQISPRQLSTNLENLPDDMLIEIIFHAQPSELKALCRSNSRLANLCRNPEVWKRKLQAQFPNARKKYQGYERERYIELEKPFRKAGKVLILYHHDYDYDDNDEVLAIFQNSTDEEIFDNLANLLNTHYNEDSTAYSHSDKLKNRIIELFGDIYSKYKTRMEEEGEITYRECLELIEEGNDVECDPYSHLIEFPLTGRLLEIIVGERLYTREFPIFV